MDGRIVIVLRLLFTLACVQGLGFLVVVAGHVIINVNLTLNIVLEVANHLAHREDRGNSWIRHMFVVSAL